MSQLPRTPLEDEIYRLLDEIHDPCSVANGNPMGLVEMGIIKAVTVSEAGHVTVDLRLTSPMCEMLPFMQGESIKGITELGGVTGCTVTRDSGFDWDHDMMSPDAKHRRQLRLLTLRDKALALQA
jgi:metal-sulfur cluster biosynthetic enzyme